MYKLIVAGALSTLALVSVAQTAEGSLGEVTNILQRLRELAVQSANSSNNATDRSFLDTEAQQLIAETNRIGLQTNFNVFP